MMATRVLVLALVASYSVAFIQQHSPPSLAIAALYSAKKKKSNGGGGFGGLKKSLPIVTTPAAADLQSLEKQWDNFVSITDLEIFPPGNPDDEDYRHFIVADVFVRIGPENEDSKLSTGWFRTGKLVAADDVDMISAFALQRGLILWTAATMWPQLSAKGQQAAKQMQLGFMPPSLNMADETETPLDEEEAEDMQILPQRLAIRGDVSLKNIGFRPDFNPKGFTYKRRERASMKKKKSGMDEIMEFN